MNQKESKTPEFTTPPGFLFGGAACGIKQNSALDLSLVTSQQPCVAAGVYTQNVVRAACIDWNRRLTPSDSIRAVVTNSGNANACTGDQGETNCEQTAKLVAERLNCQADQVVVLSTGVIGQQLPMSCLESGIADCELASDPDSFLRAADAILTTDNGRKIASANLKLDGYDGTILGMAKGAGMIGPNMATMLSIIVTDFKMSAPNAQKLLTSSVEKSFNSISVEGHTSTNDAVILLSSGIGPDVGENSAASDKFADTLDSLCIKLAKQIPADGEGATKLIDIRVSGATSDEQADQVARTIAASALVKTAITGCDPNWGRIVSAAGYAGATIELGHLTLALNSHKVFENGSPVTFDEQVVSKTIADNKETLIELNIGTGQGTSTHWTSNLTSEYIRINSEYRT